MQQICGQTVSIFWTEGRRGQKIPKFCKRHIWNPPNLVTPGSSGTITMGKGGEGRTESVSGSWNDPDIGPWLVDACKAEITFPKFGYQRCCEKASDIYEISTFNCEAIIAWTSIYHTWSAIGSERGERVVGYRLHVVASVVCRLCNLSNPSVRKRKTAKRAQMDKMDIGQTDWHTKSHQGGGEWRGDCTSCIMCVKICQWHLDNLNNITRSRMIEY